MAKKDRAEMYQAYLKEEGYAPNIDNDGDIVFKYEGRNYLIILEDNDDIFVRLVFPNFWPIESEDERAKVMLAAAHATGETKVAKVFPVNDNIWASTELFCSPPEVFKNVFKRSMNALQASVDNFAQKMRE